MSAVVTLSIVRSCRDEGTSSSVFNPDDDQDDQGLVRLGATGTARSSIDNMYAREERDLPMVDHIGNVFENIDPIRRRVSARLLSGNRVNFFPGFSMIRNDCNFEPGSFHQPFVYYVLLLTDKFNLSYPETVAVHTAMEFIPNTSLFFVAACKCMLEIWKPRSREAIGFEMGYVLVKMMKGFHRRYTQGGGRGRTPERYRRYATYVCPEVPSWTDWVTRNQYKTMLLLFAHSCHSTVTTRRRQRTVQAQVARLYILYMQHLGPLGGNHALSVASKLGLAPDWLRRFATVKGDSRYMKYFANRFYGRNSFRPGEVEQIMETLRVYMSDRFEDQFDDDFLENILCSKFALHFVIIGRSSFPNSSLIV